jgi:hypothetical protein
MHLRFFGLAAVFTFAACQTLAQEIPDPMVAPGLVVPRTALPIAVDHFQNAPELVPIHHSNVELNNHKGANVAGSIVGGIFYKPKMTVEVEGAHARSVVHDAKPTFYLHMLQDPGDTGPEDVYAIIRALPEKDRRIFAQVRFTQMTGNAKRDDGIVETVTEHLPNGWLRLTPKDALTPGEYAVSPIMRTQNAFPTMIYDFMLDPSAPNATDALLARP